MDRIIVYITLNRNMKSAIKHSEISESQRADVNQILTTKNLLERTFLWNRWPKTAICPSYLQFCDLHNSSVG